MKIYKLFWTRVVGLAAFLGTVFFICSNQSPPPNYIQYGSDADEDSTSGGGTQYVAQAVSFFRNIVNTGDGVTSRIVRFRTQRDTRSTDEDDDVVEADDDDNENGIFQEGDFDYQMTNDTIAALSSTSTKRELTATTTVVVPTGQVHFRVPVKLKTRKSPRNITVLVKELPIVEDGIYWSKELEQKMPQGLSDVQVGQFLYKTRHLKVTSVEPPTWNRCGRPKNQFVSFEDGNRACARYRTPHNYLVQGEVLSFYLSRLLDIHHVPSVTLSTVDKGQQWKSPNVTASLKTAAWLENATVALIQWVDGLERDRMPALLLNSLLKKKTISWKTPDLVNLTTNQTLELLQWSNLIVFDYITGNYDRVASMQDAADKEKKLSILHETIHNLVTSRQTGSLWLIDNESGLLDSYTLLYGSPNAGSPPPEHKFLAFHGDMLRTICVFRRALVDRIRWLYHRGNRAARVLVDFTKRYEPLYRRLPDIFQKNGDFVKHFHQRIAEVYQHIKSCRLL